MAFKPQFRVTPCPLDKFRTLISEGLSLTSTARRLHIAPRTLKERLEKDALLQEAYRLGLADRKNNPSLPVPPATNARRAACDDAEFGREPEEKPIDGIIYRAIRAGLSDRPAIERVLRPLIGRRVQVLPALERLIQHGKILEAPRTPGIILTRYRPAPPQQNAFA